MESRRSPGSRSPTAAARDLAVVAVVAGIAAALCVRYDLSEMLLAWTRLHERFQLDELPAVLLVIAVSLVWFSTRRHLETRRQLAIQEATEQRLEEALAENQRLAQQYLDMRESERKALARDLHDELGQYLNVIKLDAVTLRDASAVDSTPVARAGLQATALGMIEMVDRIYRVVADLIRQLRPVGFDDLGVAAALEHCVAEWRLRLGAVSIDSMIDPACAELDEARALAVFRVVQESLTNIARHARARRVTIRVERVSHAEPRPGIRIVVQDDGRGMHIDAPHVGLGLVGMRERVTALGGSLKLASAPDHGFTLTAFIPLAHG